VIAHGNQGEEYEETGQGSESIAIITSQTGRDVDKEDCAEGSVVEVVVVWFHRTRSFAGEQAERRPIDPLIIHREFTG